MATWQELRDADVLKRNGRKPLTQNHIKYIKYIEEHLITIGVGAAGTGKTSLACQTGAKLLKAGRYEKIILTRPLIQCDEELGILPGDLNEKTAPFMAPLTESLKETFGEDDYNRYVAAGRIEICPLAVMRGRTLSDSFIVADELQNATYGQIRMLLTRLGHNSKMVLCGDVYQSDKFSAVDVPLAKVMAKLACLTEIAWVHFTGDDVLRPGIVQYIDELLST